MNKGILNFDFTRAKDENDFLILLYADSVANGDSSKCYCRVTHIKNERISPDIDLLYVDPNPSRRSPFHSSHRGFIEAFELKSIKKKGRYEKFYTGIGQALLYYRFGVDKVTLLIGYFGESESEAKDISFELRKRCLFLQKNILRNVLLYIGFFEAPKGRSDQLFPLPAESAQSLYNPSPIPIDKEIERKRESLLNEKFSRWKNWPNNYLKKRGKELGIKNCLRRL